MCCWVLFMFVERNALDSQLTNEQIEREIKIYTEEVWPFHFSSTLYSFCTSTQFTVSNAIVILECTTLGKIGKIENWTEKNYPWRETRIRETL
jgi:hypothetical protein